MDKFNKLAGALPLGEKIRDTHTQMGPSAGVKSIPAGRGGK